jgi:hypothetical protein
MSFRSENPSVPEESALSAQTSASAELYMVPTDPWILDAFGFIWATEENMDNLFHFLVGNTLTHSLYYLSTFPVAEHMSDEDQMAFLSGASPPYACAVMSVLVSAYHTTIRSRY